LKLLYEPVTFPCGHSCCKRCDRELSRAANSYKCPICRAALSAAPSTSIVLHQLLAHTFPAEYALRRQEDEAEPALPAPESERMLPLFVLDAMLPGQRMYLNVFEVRYRLLVQRCLSEGKPFGMTGGNPYSAPSDYGTEVGSQPVLVNRKSSAVGTGGDRRCWGRPPLWNIDAARLSTLHTRHALTRPPQVEIVSAQPQSDGRFHLEILGKRVFHVSRRQMKDG
jgi:hypothetical protein